MPTEKSSPLVHDDSKWMDAILAGLNHKNLKVRGEMRRLVAAWDDTGRDAGKTLQALPELRPYLWDKFGQSSWRLNFGTSGSGLLCIPDPDVRDVPAMTEREIYEARLMFVYFLLNERRDNLAGPCKWKHCDSYFLLRGKRRTAHCSRRCCQLDAASRYTKERLQREHADKLHRAGAAAQKWAKEWRKGRTRKDWKQRVSEIEPDITTKFLTRAVTNDEFTINGELTARGKTFVREHPQRKAGKS